VSLLDAWLGPRGQRKASLVAFAIYVPARAIVWVLVKLGIPLTEESRCRR